MGAVCHFRRDKYPVLAVCLCLPRAGQHSPLKGHLARGNSCARAAPLGATLDQLLRRRPLLAELLSLGQEPNARPQPYRLAPGVFLDRSPDQVGLVLALVAWTFLDFRRPGCLRFSLRTVPRHPRTWLGYRLQCSGQFSPRATNWTARTALNYAAY